MLYCSDLRETQALLRHRHRANAFVCCREQRIRNRRQNRRQGNFAFIVCQQLDHRFEDEAGLRRCAGAVIDQGRHQSLLRSAAIIRVVRV